MSFFEFVKWFFDRYVTAEHFTNVLALIVVMPYVYKEVNGSTVSESYSLLVGMVLGYFFKRTFESSGPSDKLPKI